MKTCPELETSHFGYKCSPLNQILKIIIKHRALHYVINLFLVLPKRIHYIYIRCYLFHAACAILLKILILRQEVPLWRLHLTVQCQELTKLWAMVPTTGLQKTLGSHVEGAHTCCKQLWRRFNLVTPNYYCFVPYKVFTGWLLPDFAGGQYHNWKSRCLNTLVSLQHYIHKSMVWIFSPPATKQIHQKKLSEKILYETIADALGADCFS